MVSETESSELWLEIVRRLYRTKSLYLVGAKEEGIAKAVGKLRKATGMGSKLDADGGSLFDAV